MDFQIGHERLVSRHTKQLEYETMCPALYRYVLDIDPLAPFEPAALRKALVTHNVDSAEMLQFMDWGALHYIAQQVLRRTPRDMTP